jgi:hypothetical protein
MIYVLPCHSNCNLSYNSQIMQQNISAYLGEGWSITTQLLDSTPYVISIYSTIICSCEFIQLPQS